MKRILLIISVILITDHISAQPKYEFRGVWVATVDNIDWPSTKYLSTDSQKIRDALASTKDFPGAAGKITINAQRNADKPIVIVQVKGGQFRYVTSIECLPPLLTPKAMSLVV